MTESYLELSIPASGGELNQLQQLAEQQAAYELEIAELEGKINKARENQRALAERKIPELMDQIGMAEFKTASGLIVKVEEKIRASITKAKAPLAFSWLKKNGHASMIKRVVSIAFGMGEDEEAEELWSDLNNKGFIVEDKASVHPSTLSSFAKEKLSNGEEIPLDLLGVHRQRVCKISAAK